MLWERAEDIINVRIQIIFMPRVKDAIINAKESRIEEEEYPKTIGTDVYKLVEKLVK